MSEEEVKEVPSAFQQIASGLSKEHVMQLVEVANRLELDENDPLMILIRALQIDAMLLEAIPAKILESAKEVLRQSEEDMAAFMAKVIRDTDEMIRQTRIEVSGKAAAAISSRLEELLMPLADESKKAVEDVRQAVKKASGPFQRMVIVSTIATVIAFGAGLLAGRMVVMQTEAYLAGAAWANTNYVIPFNEPYPIIGGKRVKAIDLRTKELLTP
jgi:hypothetical protein